MIALPGQPLYFEAGRRPLFGWLHEPRVARSGLGVVLCNPFGYEALCTHRTFRHLAATSAEAGHPTLRFDYEGTGDSAGEGCSGDEIAAWVASVGAAIETLKALAGVTTVCLVGLRLGALLATLAARGRADIAGLIAIAPVVSGRAYLRELRALTLARPQAPPPPWAQVREDIQEAAGFMLSSETWDALADTDLTKIQQLPTRRMFILERDELRPSLDWGGHLRSLGATVDTQIFAGYPAMTLSAHESAVPQALIKATVDWISRLPKPPAAAVPAGQERCAFDDADTSESIVRLEEGPDLFGILTIGSGSIAAVPRDAVLLLNAGAISRIGPGRLHVTLARHLARRGAAVLRLDIGGIGDSSPVAGEPENVVYAANAHADIDAALRYLRRRFPGARYHVMGICSGAYNGFKAAVAGARFDTVVAINPLTFFWKAGMSLAEPEFHVAAESARYRTTALRLASWLKLLRGKVNIRAFLRIMLRSASHSLTHQLREIGRWLSIPLENDLAKELHAALHAAGKLYFIFGSGDPGLVLLRDQGGAAVRRLSKSGKIKVEIVEGADHTFTPHWARERLIELLVAHLHEPADARLR